DSAQEIRSGEITREEGVALVKRFDGEWPARFEPELMEYLSIDESFGVAASQFSDPVMDKERFLTLADEFRSPHLWERSDGEWVLKHQVA
ncbi:MAG: N-acetyl sugar amidotransferase, partial [Ilumatobacteraceae bacterium]